MPSARAALLTVLALAACGRARPVDIQPEPSTSSPAPEAPPSAAPDPEPESSPATAVTPKASPSSEPDPFAWPEGYTPPEVWERRTVVVDGVAETWSLRWRKPPR